MKKLKFALHTVAACAIAALAVACSSDENSNNPETVTLTAYQPGSEPNTRIGFDSKGNACWQTNDAIGIWSNGESKFNSFALKTGAGEATATFSGEVTGGMGQYAVYPYNENHSISDDTLNYYLPDSYIYTKVGQTVLTDKDGNNFYTLMFGKVNGNEVTFKHIGGVICLKIDKMPAESGTVKVTETSNKLCGAFTANLSDEAPEIKTEVSEMGKTVTFTYSNATTDGVGVFYLPVATGSYNLGIQVKGNGNVSYSTKTVEMTRAKARVVNVTTSYMVDNSKTINRHYFVDLGLPSGLLWAETNVGAATAADDGNYYAWGETKPKETYDWSTYRYGTSSSDLTKYTSTDNKSILDNEDDAAYANWGSPCRMPSQSEFVELRNTDNCTWTWTSKTTLLKDTINGYEVTSKKNGNNIFLPASGNRGESAHDYRGLLGDYWSSSLDNYTTSYAYFLYFNKGGQGFGNLLRYVGRSVRPVAEP
jgi:hypothetical protein